MNRPEVIRIVPRRSQKDRNSRVEFLCPHCGEAHIIRLTVFDKITNGIYPCIKRKQRTFKAWVDKQVEAIPDKKLVEIRQAVSEGKAFQSIVKYHRLSHPAVLAAIIRPRIQPLPPPRPAVECMEAKPVGQQSSEVKAPPASSVVNNFYAPVVQHIKYPDYPMPNSTAFNQLNLRERLEADKAWVEFRKETAN